MDRLVIILILANLFNILDVATTIYAVNVLGLKEANILMKSLIEKSESLYAMFKIFSLIIISVIALKTKYILGKVSYELYCMAFGFTMLFLMACVINNLLNILIARY